MLSTGTRRLLLRNGGFHTFLYLLPLVVLLAALTGARFRGRLRAVQDADRELASATAVSFRNYLSRIWDTEQALGESIVETNPSDQTLNRLLARQISTCPSVRNLLVLDPKGRVRAGSNPSGTGRSFGDRDYVEALVRGQDTVVSNLLIGRFSRQPMLVIGRAIRRGPALKAIVIATVDVTELGEALPSREGRANVGLVDRNGRIVYQSRYPRLPYARRTVKPNSPAWEVLRRNTVAASAHVAAVSDDAMMVGTAVPIPTLGWAAFAEVARGLALAPAFREAFFAFAGFLLVVGATTLGVCLFRIELARHAIALSEAAASLAEGHYEARVTVSPSVPLARAEAAFNRMAERIQDLERERLRFIQVTAHELRTPLTSIKGICELMTGQLNSHPQTARLAGILRSEVIYLSGLVDDILNAFLLQEGRITLALQPLDLVKVVSDALQPFAAAEANRFTLHTERSPLMISGDPRRLHQVFKNIVSNAVKYSPPGTPIEVFLYSHAGSAVVAIRDQGRGIPADELAKVFDPFFRASNVEDTWTHGGIGLGLNLCQVVVERHGGRIWVESQEGSGSTFYVSLPQLAEVAPISWTG